MNWESDDDEDDGEGESELSPSVGVGAATEAVCFRKEVGVSRAVSYAGSRDISENGTMGRTDFRSHDSSAVLDVFTLLFHRSKYLKYFAGEWI